MSSIIERKLAAIMFTDIVGFTALSAKDESKALKLLDIQKQILNPIFEKFKGTLHKEMGDGLLLTFPSVTEAVNCAIKIQDQTKNNDKLNLRIGIHEGEITFKDGDVLGDDVNVASRIEPFSAVGGIAISGKIQQNISSLIEFKTKYIGKPKLKGVKQDVKVYCITSHGLPETDLSIVSAKLDKKSNLTIYGIIGCLSILFGFLFLIFLSEPEEKVPSIAIIPLENKGDDNDEFYSYSISSDLISDISSAGNIRVASIKDIEKIDYKSLTNNEIAKKLLVRYIAQGSLWKVDSSFQLSVELYDNQKSKIKWSENWIKKWSDLPSIKGGLSEKILTNLEIESNKALIKTESQNAEAYEIYLRAKNIYSKRKNIDDIDIAEELLNKSISLDQNLISAKLLMGDILRSSGKIEQAMEIFKLALKNSKEINNKLWIGRSYRKIGVIFSAQDKNDLAFEYNEKSLNIAEDLNDKYGMSQSLRNMAILMINNYDLNKAKYYFDKVNKIVEDLGDDRLLALNFSDFGNFIKRKGDNKKALEYFKKSLEIFKNLEDKYNISRQLRSIGKIYIKEKKYEKGLEYLYESLEISRNLGNKYGICSSMKDIGLFHYSLYETEKALEYFNESLTLAQEMKNESLIAQMIYYMGILSERVGDYKIALNYLENSLLMFQKIDKESKFLGIASTLANIGIIHYNNSDYDKAYNVLSESIKIIREYEMDSDQLLLKSSIYLFLTDIHLNKIYNKSEIISIANKCEDIPFEYNWRLYEYLNDDMYLETAYNQVQDEILLLSEESKNNLTNHPIPKKIIEEYNKVFGN